MGTELFKSRQQAKHGPLFGLTLNTFDPIFVDVAARLDFDVIWIEMEHSCITMREADQLCRMINGNQMLSLIRLPNGERNVALKAAETGVDMLMVPMINNPAELEQFVAHTRYAPQGERGFYRYSRAMNYGLGDTVKELRRQANENLMLWGQIETLSALDHLPELCQVDGIDGLFMGPGDLSSAYGVPGQISDQRVVDAVRTGVLTSQQYGKCAGTVSRASDAPCLIEQSIDILFVGGNVEFYVKAGESLRNELVTALTEGTSRRSLRYPPVQLGSRVDGSHLSESPSIVHRHINSDPTVADH